MSSLEPLCNFRRNPRSLELIASVVSTAMLCRQAAMMNPANPPKNFQDIIALPSAIKQKIDRFMPIVKEQIISWNNFYDREIFFDRLCRRAYHYFHVLVWSDDGTINEEETAREMLKQDDLNAVEKYRIACNHCLENEIRTLKSNLKTKIELRKVRGRYPLVYYWECICRNEKTTISLENLFDEDECMYPVSAVDYFLNRLTSEERISALQHSYFMKSTFRSWENFLMKLSNEQLVSLFDDTEILYREPYNIFDYLMRFWMHADFVEQVWMRVQDTYSDHQFSYLIKEVIKAENSMILLNEHISLAVEIFNLSPYEKQRTVFNNYMQEKWWDRHDFNLTDVRLDVTILSTVDPDYRRYQFWAENWINLFEKYPADCFVQFMNVCCGEEAPEKFKKKVMDMDNDTASRYCSTLLSEMRLSEIDQFLNTFSSDTCRIMKTKQIILRKNAVEWSNFFPETAGFTFPSLNQIVDFIEGSFDNIRSANEFKIEVLSSVCFLKGCYESAGNDMFDWLKDAVWMCSCRDDDFKLYKNKFLQLGDELTKSSGISNVFKDPGWVSFLEWCSDEC
ncbi:uncharacterized protein LOC135839065 isoform X2 [Planococcus citri]|uniref:uncharacterized protein LOC135839065 isoform X2 n=1 Tax=Planococcus citri TaxID=170843 RepID=UPI0031F99C81